MTREMELFSRTNHRVSLTGFALAVAIIVVSLMLKVPSQLYREHAGLRCAMSNTTILTEDSATTLEEPVHRRGSSVPIRGQH